MKGCIHKKGKTYCIVFDLPPINGKRRQKWLYGFDTRTQAQERLNLCLADVQRGVYSDVYTVTTYFEFWFDTHKQNLASNTISSYSNQIKYITSAFGSLPLNQLTSVAIQDFYNHLLISLSPTSVLYVHRILKNALGRAVQLDLLLKNPCDCIEPPCKAKFFPVVLNREDVVNLLNLLQLQQPELFLPVFLAVELGLRRGEILGLYCSDFNLENRTLSITRSASQSVGHSLSYSSTKTLCSNRTLLLSEKQCSIILRFSSFSSPSQLCNLVIRTDNTFYTPATLNHAFSVFLAKNNLPHMRFHDLRHSYVKPRLKNIF